VFTTADGSTIRELWHTDAQSLAEASLGVGQATTRHYHAASEEIYFVLEGRGRMELDGEVTDVGPGDAVLIPPGACPAPDHGQRAVAVSLLLRAAVLGPGHVLSISPYQVRARYVPGMGDVLKSRRCLSRHPR
jgi:hypothetical protein